jgi:demethylmenaquinone methyltransferase/2-methoxy-6-polyprenyl-1,4-benzoquinol methylase
MTQLSGNNHARYVRDLFNRIAPGYDLMNRLMTGGQDIRWRREVICRAELKPGALLLDIGAGTGDLVSEAKQQHPDAKVFASDFTLEMMRVGQRKDPFNNWSAADALSLPFGDKTFDAVVSGFLVRNVSSVDQTLREQNRVLKYGGRIVILDTTRPRRNLLTPLIWIHMHMIIPLIGGLLSGEQRAYRYLPNSTEKFITAEALVERMSATGFKRVGFQPRMFGTIAIHWGEK